MSQGSRIEVLKDRAFMLRKARSFFHERSVLEVDCPILSQFAAVDAYIDLIPAKVANTTDCFLHSSPEYGMKRLLAEGMPDIYSISHVFRDGEYGHKHNPEFMMVEWYRLGMPFQELITETLEFVQLFFESLPKVVLSYKEAFTRFAGFDPFEIADSELEKRLYDLDSTAKADSRDDCLNYILALQVEPHLGKDALCALAYYPQTQAALAKTTQIEGVKVAERFEVYYQGVELANGYHELQDAKEQLRRFQEANILREKLHKKSLPIDMRFIQALENNGLPACSGVAVGFDRLMMLRHKKNRLADIMPFDYPLA